MTTIRPALAASIGFVCLLVISIANFQSLRQFVPFESSRGNSVSSPAPLDINRHAGQTGSSTILRGENGGKEVSSSRNDEAAASLLDTSLWKKANNREWYAALSKVRYQSLCERDGIRTVIEELRGRGEETHKTLVWVAYGGGLGNQLDTILASLIGALVTNRTLRIRYTFPVLDYFEPTSAFSKWSFLDTYDPERDLSLGSTNVSAPRVKFSDFLQGEYADAQDVILYDVPTGDTSSSEIIMRELSGYLRNRGIDSSAIEEAIQCLSREFLRPKPVVVDKLREVVTSFNGAVSVGVHLRKSDSSMAAYMNVQTRGRARRRLSLDLSGAEIQRHGCTHDFTFRGCLLKYHDKVASMVYPRGVVYYVAADAVASYGVVKEVMAQRNTTVFRSDGVPTHTGRHWHAPQASSQASGEKGGMDGDLKAVLDFFTLVHVDHYIANCPFGGSTFSWNVHNARLGAPSIHGEDGLCGVVGDKHDGEYPIAEVAAAVVVFVLIVFAVAAILRRASLVPIVAGKKDTRLCLREGPH